MEANFDSDAFSTDAFSTDAWEFGDIASAALGVVFSDPPIQIMQGQGRKRRKPTDLLLLLLT